MHALLDRDGLADIRAKRGVRWFEFNAWSKNMLPGYFPSMADLEALADGC